MVIDINPTPKVMKYSKNRTSPRYWFTRTTSKHLLALALSFFALPALLSAQTLLHRYSFASDASDSVGGSAWNGVVEAPNGGSAVTIASGLTLPGGGGPGYSGYVALPAGILTATTNLTVECWVTQNSQNGWAEIFNFNNGQSQYLGLIPNPVNNNGNMSAAFKTGGNESDAFSGIQFPVGTEQDVAVTFNANTLVGNLYTNGALLASVTCPNSSYIPGTYGGSIGTANNYLGQDPFPDPQFQGTIYELRIWNGVVSQRYLAASAIEGPSVIVTALTPTSAAMTVSATSIVVSGISQPTITVQLAATGSAELPATQDAVNWVSSNTNVLSVSSTGTIVGVGAGTATVSAQVGGVAVTSPAITVASQTLLHRYSFVSDASDSVGGANGTIVAGTTGAAATIANGLVLPGNTVGGNGYSGYVSLPAGILTNTTSLTVECWATQNQGNTWAELWDFGTNSQAYNFAFIPFPADNGGNPEVASFSPGNNNDYITSHVPFPNGTEQYVAVTYNESSLVGNLYTNGNLDAALTYPSAAYAPYNYGGAGGTINNYLGNDIYGDQQFNGTIYEFRIWNGAVSPAYLAASAVAGSSVLITNTTPTSLTVSVGESSMIGSATQQATLEGNFTQVDNVTLTGAASTWTSSNPGVLTVSSSGLITAVSGGTATVSATVDGVTATSQTITVQSTAPVVQVKPANVAGVISESATFSAQAIGGNLIYQWSFNNAPISGATNNTLTLNDLTAANVGTYNLEISNSSGSTNLTATLTLTQAVLLHRYSFVSDVTDSVGGANGSIVAPSGGTAATIANGLVLPGGGGNNNGYVSLPTGILTNTSSLTIECWATQDQQNSWATIWDFGGIGTATNFEFCPYPASGHNNQNPIVAFQPNGGEQDLDANTPFPVSTEEYFTVTYNSSSFVGSLYTNGALEASVTLPNATYTPGKYAAPLGTTRNMLGNDVFGDDQFGGTIYELRIWNGAVTPEYLALSAIAGPGTVLTSLTPQSVNVTTTNSTMLAGQTQSASVLGNYSFATGVVLTSSATNWTSSNPSVLTVNSSGLITAVNTGSATISATLNGLVGTSASITVQGSGPVITQQPTSIQNLLAGASLSPTLSVVGNPPFVYRLYNGATLVGTSTNSQFSLANLQTGGTYTVVVSNALGIATSSPVTVTVVPPNAYEQVLLSLGAIAYWPLDETAGNTTFDLIGGINGYYTNGFTLGEAGPTNEFFGATSSAVNFDGTDAYADIPGAPFNITNAITVVAWEQTIGASGFDGIFGKGDDSWRLSINPTAQLGGNDGTSAVADATDPTAVAINSWHMVAYTYTGNPGDANNGALYVDGKLVSNNTILTTPAGDNLDVWIGGSPDYGVNRLFLGNIAHAAIFDQSLTAAQVNGLYNAVYVPSQGSITLTRSGSNITLTWPTGVLLQASSLTGPWTTNSAAVSPYTVPIASGNQFFRVLVSP